MMTKTKKHFLNDFDKINHLRERVSVRVKWQSVRERERVLLLQGASTMVQCFSGQSVFSEWQFQSDPLKAIKVQSLLFLDPMQRTDR